MTISDQIREVLRNAGRPLSCPEIRAALPDVDAAATVMAMAKAGYLARQGKRRHYTYTLGREVRSWDYALTSAERRRRKNERDRRRYAEMTREQRRALIARKAGKAAKPRPAAKPKPHQHIVISPSTRFERAQPAAPRLETVEDYLKRGGRIERLPMHAVSQPLRRIA